MTKRLALASAICALLLAIPLGADGGTTLAQRAAAHKPTAQDTALRGLQRARAARLISQGDAAHDRVLIHRATSLLGSLPYARSSLLRSQLDQVAAQAGSYTAPRARALFGQLGANEAYLSVHAPPASGTDITGADGVVYRYFPGSGFEFHPLANFGALNLAVAKSDTARTESLARALIDRGVPERGGGLGWEYYFAFGGGHPPWTSGMAQAVAAQSLARASQLLGEPGLAAAARSAYEAIPGRLVRGFTGGSWIRLYSFSNLTVFNAQLQSAISLDDYGSLTGDTRATRLAALLRGAALANLARFDTGYWSYYALPSVTSPLDYQQYVVTLLRKLGKQNPVFGEAATRIGGYAKQPPALKLADGGPLAVRFWLSKPSTVTVSSRGAQQSLFLGGGEHTLPLSFPPTTGTYAVTVRATDLAGNRATVEMLPVVRVVGAKNPKPKPKPTKPRHSLVSPFKATAVPLAQASFFAGVTVAAGDIAPATPAFRVMKFTVDWAPGEVAPDPSTVATLTAAAAKSQVIVELNAPLLPADETAQSELTEFVTALVGQVPDLSAITLEPTATKTTAAAYLTTLATIGAAAKATSPTIGADVELDGAAAPATVLAALRTAFKTVGGFAPDAILLRPAPAAATGAWTLASYPTALATIDRTFPSPSAPIPVIYDALPAAAKSPTGAPPGYATAIATATCQPRIAGIILPNVGAAQTAAAAIAAAQRGTLAVCPGLATPAVPSLVEFPATATQPLVVRLGCLRDCLYLVTLERDSDNAPILAKRGALVGAAAPATIRLPVTPIPAGAYHLTVRLISTTNPGPMSLTRSGTLEK